MPSKKTKTSRTAKRPSSKQFQFRWWMAVIIVLLVAIVGIVIIRLSFAGNSYRVKIDDSTTDRSKFYLILYNQGHEVRGSITKFQTFGGYQGSPPLTQWKMQLNNGLIACGELRTLNMKNTISNPSLPTEANWVVTNPSCAKG